MSRPEPSGTASSAARPDAIRRHNLAMLLGEVHRDGALTRAELTSRLGVSRSTVGALVSDLADLGLIEESVPSGGERVGRPSYVVGPHAQAPVVVAVDVDVSHVTVAAVGIGGVVLGRRSHVDGPHPPHPEQVADLVADAVRELGHADGRTLLGVGVSVPGTVDRRSLTVGMAPNLDWAEVPLGELIRRRIGPAVPVAVGNDADLSVLAEHSRGHARGCDDVVYVIGRIGVGAGLIVNGHPLQGRDGRAGEIGHNVVDAAGPRCHCGKRGCLETIIGDTALLALAGRTGAPTDEEMSRFFADARSGDRDALAAVQTSAGWLGQALGNLVNTLNPQLVILGGSLSGVLELARPEIERSLQQYAFDPGHPVELTLPRFRADSALLGAAELAFAALLEDPYAGRPLLTR